MVTSLGLVILIGLLANALFIRLKMPGLIGMLLVGVLLGPYVFNLLDSKLLLVSGEFRKLALIIILLRAGLGIGREDLKKVGKSALWMSFVPGVLEGFAIAFASQQLLGLSFIEGGLLGFILAAVSPAVVVPQMIAYSEQRRGVAKGIPTLILASASVDDVFAITLFSAFLGFYSGSKVNIGVQLMGVPISIALGITFGVLIGFLLIRVFERYDIRDTKKVLYVLGASIVLTTLESVFKGTVEIAGLIGVMAIGFVLLEKKPETAKNLANKFGKIWIFAELLLFVLVGAEVNIHVALQSGLKGVCLIGIGLVFRSFGVWLSLMGTSFTFKEKMFCIIAYLPKATVQAAMGGIPLALGVQSGEIILAIAVLAILITAPLGAIGIHWSGKKWLSIDV